MLTEALLMSTHSIYFYRLLHDSGGVLWMLDVHVSFSVFRFSDVNE